MCGEKVSAFASLAHVQEFTYPVFHRARAGANNEHYIALRQDSR
jgi:hypothetical protein